MSGSPTSPALQGFLERLAAIRGGRHPAAVARLSSGWVVLGDWQLLPGYCQLIADPVVAHLNELRGPARQRFLDDAAIVGDALLQVTDALRVNYQILGNVCPALHAHIVPRYAWEDPAKLTGATAIYFQGGGPKFSEGEHGDLRLRLAQAIGRLHKA